MADLMDVLGRGAQADVAPEDTAQKPGGAKEMIITVNGDGSFMLDGETMDGPGLLRAVEAIVGVPAGPEAPPEEMPPDAAPAAMAPPDIFANPRQFSRRK